MSDIQKVLKGLEFCLGNECKGEECPYFIHDDCSTALIQDSLELLKEWCNGEGERMWKPTAKHEPPKGEPLIATIQCKWKNWREVLVPVYYIYDMYLSKWVFYNGVDNSIIGPNDVEVVAWMRLPSAYGGLMPQRKGGDA